MKAEHEYVTSGGFCRDPQFLVGQGSDLVEDQCPGWRGLRMGGQGLRLGAWDLVFEVLCLPSSSAPPPSPHHPSHILALWWESWMGHSDSCCQVFSHVAPLLDVPVVCWTVGWGQLRDALSVPQSCLAGVDGAPRMVLRPRARVAAGVWAQGPPSPAGRGCPTVCVGTWLPRAQALAWGCSLRGGTQPFFSCHWNPECSQSS